MHSSTLEVLERKAPPHISKETVWVRLFQERDVFKATIGELRLFASVNDPAHPAVMMKAIQARRRQ